MFALGSEYRIKNESVPGFKDPREKYKPREYFFQPLLDFFLSKTLKNISHVDKAVCL